jgi:sulfopyruvate decarboxylase TPP-binding subunit
MLNGTELAQALRANGVTHIVWIPDSEVGKWEPAFLSEPGLQLLRVSREGEAIGVAAGLLIGGKFPVVILQCTGLFEAGDALRNVVHDLKLPLFLIIGVRGHLAAQKGPTVDTCPRFAVPIMDAWQFPYRLLEENASVADVVATLQSVQKTGQAGAVLLPE